MSSLPERMKQLTPERQALLARLLRRQTEETAPRPIAPRSPGQGLLPVSFAQRRFWFLSQLEPSSPASNIYRTYRLVGPLSVSALERTWSEICRRHEILQTTFEAADGEPVQIVHPPVEQRIPVIDMSRLAPEVQE